MCTYHHIFPIWLSGTNTISSSSKKCTDMSGYLFIRSQFHIWYHSCIYSLILVFELLSACCDFHAPLKCGHYNIILTGSCECHLQNWLCLILAVRKKAKMLKTALMQRFKLSNDKTKMVCNKCTCNQGLSLTKTIMKKNHYCLMQSFT